jgi:zinc transporter 9
MAAEGKGAVYKAMIGNGILTVLKFAAFLLSGSGAMMSEAVHSFADTANQALLYVGLRRSQRPADAHFQYGYGADRYIFALMSAMGIFVLGCGVTVYHGVHSLIDPPSLHLSWVSFAVLGASLLIDGSVLLSAIAEINKLRGDKGFVEFIRSSTDPTLIAVLFEDGVASLGVAIAGVGIFLSHLTGNPVFDATASIVIGAMMGAMALWLGWRNRELILGPAIPEEMQAQVLEYLRSKESVDRVSDFRTRIVAAKRFRIAAEVDFNGRYFGRQHARWLRESAADLKDDEGWEHLAEEFGEKIVQQLANEVDLIEAELGAKFPRIRHIDVEAD